LHDLLSHPGRELLQLNVASERERVQKEVRLQDLLDALGLALLIRDVIGSDPFAGHRLLDFLALHLRFIQIQEVFTRLLQQHIVVALPGASDVDILQELVKERVG
jgi:hypothetical protein